MSLFKPLLLKNQIGISAGKVHDLVFFSWTIDFDWMGRVLIEFVTSFTCISGNNSVKRHLYPRFRLCSPCVLLFWLGLPVSMV